MIVTPLKAAACVNPTRDVPVAAEFGNSELALLRTRFVMVAATAHFNLPPRFDYVVCCVASNIQLELADAVARASDVNRLTRSVLQADIASHPARAGTSDLPKIPSLAGALPEHWEDSGELLSASTKLRVFLRLARLVLDHTSDKMVVFAHHVELLELFKMALEKQYVGSERLWHGRVLKGDLRQTERARMVDQLNDQHSDVRILWISSKAGGAGLTLTGANRAFLIDPHPNPAIEKQAFGRLHRTGARGSVYQYILVTAGLADEALLVRQLMKCNLSRAAFAQELPTSMIQLSGDLSGARTHPDPLTGKASVLYEVLPVASHVADPIARELLPVCGDPTNSEVEVVFEWSQWLYPAADGPEPGVRQRRQSEEAQRVTAGVASPAVGGGNAGPHDGSAAFHSPPALRVSRPSV
mmetsp:Transcript_24190/g.62337  ORF Transcript_24190/g.62337 Transcript_24190/m.62337 type:complete len:413 (-) Transcript_24190:53-1291(-)